MTNISGTLIELLPNLVKKCLDSAEFNMLYFAECGAFCIFAAKYSTYECYYW
jgi:hypothetical protein